MPDTGIGYVYSRFIIHLGHKQRRFVDRITVFELFGVEVGRIYNVWHTTAEVNTWIDARKDDGKGANANKWSHEININGLQTYRTTDVTATVNIENIPIITRSINAIIEPLFQS